MAINARVDQSVREAIVTGNPDARVDQSVREALVTGNPDARVDQSVREAVVTGNPHANVDQSVREAVLSFNPNARIAQVVREAIILPPVPATQMMAFDNPANEQLAAVINFRAIEANEDVRLPLPRLLPPIVFVVT